MYEVTEAITEKLKQSGEFLAVVVVRECEILNFYEQTCDKFCSHFGLPLKSEFKPTLFKDAFHAAVSRQFPMFGVTKLTMKIIINAIKSGHLNGFLKITISVGPKGQEKLGGFQPFSYFEKEKKVKNSFAIEESIVTTDMVRFLLNSPELPDVIISKIHAIHEFHKPLNQPFKESATKVLDLIEKNKSDKPYSTVLKDMTNMFVGNFAVKPSKWPNSVIVKNEDLESINQLKRFVSAFNIDANFALAYFQNTA